jgi:hypothetical protein
MSIFLSGDLRVCTYCCKVVLNYAQQTDSSGDLRALREDLKCLANIENEAGVYQEFGRWTPSRKRTGADEEILGPTRFVPSLGVLTYHNYGHHTSVW